MSPAIAILLTVTAGYLLGSICFGIIFTRLFANIDVRDCGSGSAGMTNVLRNAGALPGALTGICDFMKGAAAILIGQMLFANAGLDSYTGGCLAAASAVLGHLFPLYFGFRGGKGVMVSAGFLIILNPYLLLGVLVVFAITFGLSRIVSLSSICAASSAPILNFIIQSISGGERIMSTLFLLCIAGLIVYMHRTNIARLRAGTEKKLVIKK